MQIITYDASIVVKCGFTLIVVYRTKFTYIGAQKVLQILDAKGGDQFCDDGVEEKKGGGEPKFCQNVRRRAKGLHPMYSSYKYGDFL